MWNILVQNPINCRNPSIQLFTSVKVYCFIFIGKWIIWFLGFGRFFFLIRFFKNRLFKGEIKSERPLVCNSNVTVLLYYGIALYFPKFWESFPLFGSEIRYDSPIKIYFKSPLNSLWRKQLFQHWTSSITALLPNKIILKSLKLFTICLEPQEYIFLLKFNLCFVLRSTTL